MVGCWNVEWFADPDAGTLGPTDNARQQANVQTVLQTRSDVDVWGIEEIVGTTEFTTVATNLSGYGLVLSTAVQAGTFYYGFAEQKVALLYRQSKLSLISARLILTQSSYDFGGRPPLEGRFQLMVNGVPRELYIIVLHMKAYADVDSYNRRNAASAALKDYLDTVRAADSVMVIGDWNDDVDVSTYMGSPSPYLNLVSDTVRYKYPTKELSDANRKTAASSSASSTIDHQLINAPLFGSYVTGSASATIPAIPGFTSNTSDHYPVTTRHIFR